MRPLLFLVAFAGVVAAQRPSAPTPAPAAPSGPSLKGPPVPGDALGFDVNLAITGRVLLDSRQPPPEPVPVEYSCRGAARGALTDTKGRFSILIGHQQVSRTSLANALPEIEGCRVQVRIPGFEEILVTLKRPHGLGDLNVGDLVLKSVGLQGRAVFSESGRNAPGKARSNYVHALEAINAGKQAPALASLDKAIAEYPHYAAALQVKGYLLELMGQREGAREAYQQAVAADPAYAKPLVQLAELAADDQNAAEAARWAAQVNQVVPGAFPSMYLTEGSAYFNLGRYDEAEKAARAGIDADPQHMYPGLRRLLGELLYRKQSYAAALDEFEQYVKDAPDASDASDIRERVQSCKRLSSISNK
jgi:tetratricopeptide (TPR) repeat protein